MEPRRWKQRASRAREAEGKVEDQEKDHREGQKENNVQDDQEEVDPSSVS